MSDRTWRLDTVRFTVKGQAPAIFLSRAAAQGVRIRALRCVEGGYTGTVAGMDLPRLRSIAQEGDWTLVFTARSGLGFFLDWLLERPGLPVGAALFLAMVNLLSGFVWQMDFGQMDAIQQRELRGLLAECGITEGSWLTRERLQAAQTHASSQSNAYGWISLNFIGGCLVVENMPAEYQTITVEPGPTALYAKASGQVLAIEAQSGFAAVKTGQYVTEGQLLVDCTRLDRSGDPVTQGASGKVSARIEKRYTAVQPLRAEQTVLRGTHTQTDRLFLLGRYWGEKAGEVTEEGLRQTEWLPLQAGRISLPGHILRQTVWQTDTEQLVYTPEQAAALARRSCHEQLLAEFPDAVIETQQIEQQSSGETAACTITYLFTADIAKSAE